MYSLSFSHQTRPHSSLNISSLIALNHVKSHLVTRSSSSPDSFIISFNASKIHSNLAMSPISYCFIDCATYLNVETAQAIDQIHGSCVHKILSGLHTFHMEYDPHSNLGKLPQCFVREFGSLIDTHVMLQDPNGNEFQVRVLKKCNEMYFEQGWLVLRDFYDIWFGAWVSFTYINLKLLIIRLTTRWGTNVKYPFHDPPHKHMLATTGTNSNIGTSTDLRTSSNVLVLPRSSVRTYLKRLTLYDVQSGILVLPWYGFGEFAFAYTFNELVLVDHVGCRYPCRVQFGVDSEGELACKVFGRWMDFCRKHCLAEGQKIRFAVNEPTRNFVMYVCVYPQIGIQTTLSYPLNDDSYLLLCVSQQYFVASS
ncbi:uncharacterized protein LOC123904251 [Trifolium pratense]|uniref:uncharacterized protein LOC123904251 n=1 Tax=Trifolium pratense TaxID=57577 RepID=UPI001E69004E|nr:uncharacterized protein LOC123904251 [Trifolium pratense]